ncbi:MAG: hypothetical protein WAP03_19210 [Methylorubrum rhodinum]
MRRRIERFADEERSPVKECWFNVYVRNGRTLLGAVHPSRDDAGFFYCRETPPAYRLHVRMKETP